MDQVNADKNLGDESADRKTGQGWQPIGTAPRDIHWKNGFHNFGPLILAYPVNGRVDTVEWWQSERRADACNFLDGGGNAAHPKFWMPLPDPPEVKD